MIDSKPERWNKSFRNKLFVVREFSFSGKSHYFWRERFNQSRPKNNVIYNCGTCVAARYQNEEFLFFRFHLLEVKFREIFRKRLVAMISNGILNSLCIIIGILISSKLCSSVAEVDDEDCLSRGRNCTWCLSDGNCGFCDKCGDHCHKPGAIHSLENCTNCASCIPGNLAGSKKGYDCRAEWWGT